MGIEVRSFAGEIAGIESTVPCGPVVETYLLQARERHGHYVAVAALLAPFAGAVGAPVAAGLWFWEGAVCSGTVGEL